MQRADDPVVLGPPIVAGQQATIAGTAVSYPARAIRVHLPGRVLLPPALVLELEAEDRETRARQMAVLMRGLLQDAHEAAPELDLRAAVMIDTRPGAGR